MIKSLKLLLLVSLLFAGCAKFEQDYPVRTYYLLDVQRTSRNPVTLNKVIEINRFNVSPKYSGREFIYRTKGDKYASDFYNQFFKTPAAMINAETFQWLYASGIFKEVIDRTIPVEADYLLNANITDIYVDLSDPADIKSVMSIQFFLTEETSSDSKLLFNKNYREEVSAESKSPDSFTKSWNTALELILTSFEKDIVDLKL